MKIPTVLKESLHFDDSCFVIDTIDTSLVSCMQDFLCRDVLELSLKSNGEHDYENLKVEKILAHLEARDHITSRSGFEKIDTRSEVRL